MRKSTTIYYSLLYFSIFIIALIPFKEMILNEGFLRSTILTYLTENTAGFWLFIVIVVGISGMGLYLLGKGYKKFFFKSNEEEEDLRLVSDDLFIIFFLLAWFLYSMPILLFNNDSNLKLTLFSGYEALIYSFSYVLFIKMGYIVKIIRKEQADEKKAQLIQLPNGKQFGYIFLISVILLAFHIILSVLLSYTSGFLQPDGRELILFMAFCSIPLEEIVFRGLVLDVFFYISLEVFHDISKTPRSQRTIDDNSQLGKLNKHNEERAWFVAILISSVLFGLFHLNRYGYDIYSISYLIIMGVFMGFARKIAGMKSAYLIHLANNLLAIGLLAMG